MQINIKQWIDALKFRIKFTNLSLMFTDMTFMILSFWSYGFGYGLRPKAEVFMAEHSATAKGEKFGYGPTLISSQMSSTANS